MKRSSKLALPKSPTNLLVAWALSGDQWRRRANNRCLVNIVRKEVLGVTDQVCKTETDRKW